MNLTFDDFPAFYKAVHGYDKFPWQQRLIEEVMDESKSWPGVLALPTSSGKTSLIDIAVFALALQSGRPRSERSAPLRIFFVIDRRIVVDEAAEHAQRLASKLQEANDQPETADPVLREVASRLSSYSGGRSLPLQVVALRGGMYRDESWTSTPSAPTVCLSTVDQIGSRLLFRGYGLSEYQWPIHAGLIGSDALLILDEAHLSNPFWETLQAVRRYQTWAEQSVTQPWRIVQMTATPSTNSKPFKLQEDDYQNEVLGKRLTASKLAELVETEAGQFESTVVEQAQKLAKSEKVQVVGIVVNRVASARQIFEALRQDEQVDAVLLTGRIRPFDRDRLLEKWLEKMRAGRTRSAYAGEKKLYVVATQTIEVGANLDFDALVTEAATLDALRQRFGRLDRLGELKRTLACIVLRPPEKDEKGKDKIDPIYGEALLKTWDLLNQVATEVEDRRISKTRLSSPCQGFNQVATEVEDRRIVDFGVVTLDSTLKAASDRAIKNASLKPDDLTAKLIAKLCEKPKSAKKADPLVSHLNSLLSEELRAKLNLVNAWKADKNDKAAKKEKEKAAKDATKRLAGELNEFLKGSLLFSAQAFEQVNLSDEAQEMLASEPDGEALVFLNRRLLEEAFPQEIKKQSGVVTRHRNPAPILFPAHLDSWVQTSPAPHADPDPALFLHGRDALGCADVQIVWRADLDTLPEKKWVGVVALAPPVVREALPVPLWVAQAWLTQITKPARAEDIDVADIEGISSESEEQARRGRMAHGKGAWALRWRGPEKEDTKPIKADEISPGDTLVVPSSYRGADEYGWHPSSPAPVKDIGDECANQIAHEFAVSAFRRRPYRLRLEVDRLRALGNESDINETEEADEAVRVAREEINDLLRAYCEQAENSFNLQAAEAMLDPDKARKLIPYPDNTLKRVVLTMKPKKRETKPLKSASTSTLESSDDHTDSDDTASLIGKPASLRTHCAGVGRWAKTFAEQCNLPQELIEDLELAGRLHDLGKADRRFQIWLHDGDEIAEATSPEPLAKSGRMQPNNRAAIRAARKRAGYPKGARHELLSVALVRNSEVLKASAHDWELVLHLVGTHHGYGRPFPPVIFDPKPETVTVEIESQLDGIGLFITEKVKRERAISNAGSQLLTSSSDHGLESLKSGWVEQFWRLVRRYGVWGLAYLEALLRLADYARSAQEQAGNDE